MKRKHIPLKEKFAAALYECERLLNLICPGQPGSQVDSFHKLVAGHRAKRASADAVIGLFHIDHVMYHAHGGPDLWWNLTPLPAWEHVEKTAKVDVPAIAKSKRIRRKEAAHRGAIALARLGVSPLPQPARHKRKIPSRPFAKRHK